MGRGSRPLLQESTLYNRWGWLETLRRAEAFDTIRVGSETIGWFFELAGFVTVDHDKPGNWGYELMETLTSEYVVSKVGNASVFDTYEIKGSRGLFFQPYKFTTPTTSKYYQLRYEPDRVDMESVIMDELGIITAGASNIVSGRIKAAAKVGSTSIGGAGVFKSLTVTPRDPVGAILNGVSAIPGVSPWWSVGCLGYDLSKGIYYGP